MKEFSSTNTSFQNIQTLSETNQYVLDKNKSRINVPDPKGKIQKIRNPRAGPVKIEPNVQMKDMLKTVINPDPLPTKNFRQLTMTDKKPIRKKQEQIIFENLEHLHKKTPRYEMMESPHIINRKKVQNNSTSGPDRVPMPGLPQLQNKNSLSCNNSEVTSTKVKMEQQYMKILQK